MKAKKKLLIGIGIIFSLITFFKLLFFLFTTDMEPGKNGLLVIFIKDPGTILFIFISVISFLIAGMKKKTDSRKNHPSTVVLEKK